MKTKVTQLGLSQNNSIGNCKRDKLIAIRNVKNIDVHICSECFPITKIIPVLFQQVKLACFALILHWVLIELLQMFYLDYYEFQ